MLTLQSKKKPVSPFAISRFVARQPIFDQHQQVFGYELLFRSGTDNFFSCPDGDSASIQVVNSCLIDFGLDALIGRKRAFINYTRRLLLDDSISNFPNDRVVVELLETVEPDDEVLQACERLKRQGYMLALDDFVYGPEYERLLPFADIIKVDFLTSTREQRLLLRERFYSHKARLLAEKVETKEQFREACELGYTYFQGYFFCKPEIVSRKTIPGCKLNYLQFLNAVNRPKVEFNELEQIVKREVSLSIKLLRYLNSSVFGWQQRIDSIKQALVMLGTRGLQLWSNLIALTMLCEDKTSELLLTCLIRARFCEFLGQAVGLTSRSLDLFLTGLFSGLEAVMDCPLSTLLSEMAVNHEVEDALLGSSSRLGRVLTLVLAYERGDWSRALQLAHGFDIPEDIVAGYYQQSLQWAENVNRVV